MYVTLVFRRAERHSTGILFLLKGVGFLKNIIRSKSVLIFIMDWTGITPEESPMNQLPYLQCAAWWGTVLEVIWDSRIHPLPAGDSLVP